MDLRNVIAWDRSEKKTCLSTSIRRVLNIHEHEKKKSSAVVCDFFTLCSLLNMPIFVLVCAQKTTTNAFQMLIPPTQGRLAARVSEKKNVGLLLLFFFPSSIRQSNCRAYIKNMMVFLSFFFGYKRSSCVRLFR